MDQYHGHDVARRGAGMKLQLTEFDILKGQVQLLARENANLQLRLSQSEATLQALAAKVEKLPELVNADLPA